jgi:hypothetical protein
MAALSDGEACCHSSSSAACGALEAALASRRGGAWLEARSATEVLQAAHVLAAAPRAPAGAAPLRLRFTCEEEPPGGRLPPGLLSPFSNAVCFFAQTLRLGAPDEAHAGGARGGAGGSDAPAPGVEAVDVAMPAWAQPWECATVAVAFAWSLQAPGALRSLRLRVPAGTHAALDPQHAEALRKV